MELYKPTDLLRKQTKHVLFFKSKYIKRWKGKDGKWRYQYKTGEGKTGASEDIKQQFIPAPQFDPITWSSVKNDPNASVDTILKDLNDPTIIAKIRDTEKRLQDVTPTIDKHRLVGEGARATYTPERTELHADIIERVLNKKVRDSARPAKGENPMLIMLGGRGGSGKSSLRGNKYDPDRCVVLDSDEIKQMLPEYQGWNAFEVHEESSDILEKITILAKSMKLNVVVDATLKTPASAVARAKDFISAGYDFECHYMHLPRQDAAKRAVKRFMGLTNRYVPIPVILKNTENEKSFNQLKGMASSWSFSDSSGTPPPDLISQKGQPKLARSA